MWKAVVRSYSRSTAAETARTVSMAFSNPNAVTIIRKSNATKYRRRKFTSYQKNTRK